MNNNSKISIIVIATNTYLSLGIRFVKKFLYYYEGNCEISFYFFSEDNPYKYLSETESQHVIHIQQKHNSWVDGTNSKYKNIISLESIDTDYVFYFDADTEVSKKFNEDWFLGKLVAGEHYANNMWMKEIKNFDRNPNSKAYVPMNTDLSQMYYYGAFFGGQKDELISLCKILYNWQLCDKQIGYEPCANDESYLNAYFHYNPPSKIVTCRNFAFDISHKGGIKNIRNTGLDMTQIKEQMILCKDHVFNIVNGNIVC